MRWRSLLLIVIFFFFVVFPAFASSSYVLPYPSAMPGGYLYKVNLVKEILQKYWSFGSFSQFHYNLHYADKYLVEAKTLFEYKQYFLAISALRKSNTYFVSANLSLIRAEKEGKIVSIKKKVIDESSRKHVEVLEALKKDVPEEFVWTEEKKTTVTLKLHNELSKSISIRDKK